VTAISWTWRTQARCATRPDLDWIDPKPDQVDYCRAICAVCPVRTYCQTEALITGEPWGIWGGLDTDERELIAERDGYPLPSIKPSHGTNSRYAKHGCRCQACRNAHNEYDRRRRVNRVRMGAT
jgi:hypothetical protein